MPIPSRKDPVGSPAFSAHGFRRFMDRLMLHGLEHLNLYYGTYRAQVVENEDEDSMGRVRIRCPAVGDTDQTPPRLAYPIVPLAGSSFGQHFIPPKDGYCYVVFENGRVDIPLWFGGWWAADDIPGELEGVDQFWMLTPGGHLLLLDDTSSEERIQLKHGVTEAEIVLDKDGNITITNQSGQIVTVGAGSNEPAVIGDTLKSLLEQTLDAINQITVPTGVGPSGPPINAAQFVAIKQQLQTALSQTVQVAR